MDPTRYLSGNRVYRGGSSAPTMGTVNPQGYVERELRKRRMLMPPSRSGLAQAALQRIAGKVSGPDRTTMPVSNRGYFPGGSPGGVLRQFQPAPDRTTMPIPKPITDGMGNPMPGQPGSDLNGDGKVDGLDKIMGNYLNNRKLITDPMAAAKAAQLMQQKRMVPVSGPTGKIHAPGQVKKAAPKPRPTALPWDLEANNAKIKANGDFRALLNQVLQQKQEGQKAYSNDMFQLDKEQPQVENQLLNAFAGRGLARSSGYGLGVGNLQNEFAGQRSAAHQRLTDLLNAATQKEGQGRSNLQHQLAMIQQALATRLAGRAGKLGLGKVK